MLRCWGPAVLLAIAVASCGPNAGPEAKTEHVTKAQFEAANRKWPLAVDQGDIGCEAGATWFMSPDGTKYGLDATAKKRLRLPDIKSIWLEDTEANARIEAVTKQKQQYPLRIYIGNLLDDAMALCSNAKP